MKKLPILCLSLCSLFFIKTAWSEQVNDDKNVTVEEESSSSDPKQNAQEVSANQVDVVVKADSDSDDKKNKVESPDPTTSNTENSTVEQNAVETSTTETELSEAATTPEENVISITSTLNESHPIVGQKVSISYLVSVKGYFNGSTQFQLPSLSKARLAQDSEFAVNGNTVIKGEKYATQLWQVNLYPSQAGLLEIPALNFSVKYIDHKGNQQQASLQSESLAIFAYLPEQLKQINAFIVSSKVSLSDKWSELPEEYKVGDIIQRDVTITASDINSIEIPQISYQAIDGLQVTAQEAQLEDQSNRGEQLATLKQTVTYVVKEPGAHSLGGEVINWWSLDKGLQQSHFETHQIDVPGISSMQIKVFVIVSVFAILFALLFFKFKKVPPSLSRQLKAALKNKQWPLLIRLLYQKADQSTTLGLLKEGEKGEVASELLNMHYQPQSKTVNAVNDSRLKELIK